MPLTGVRVLDFGRYIAGPYCAALLADYGAEVIRIEAPGGNDDRFSIPVAEDGSGGMYMQMNRNKQSLTLKPGSDQGRAIIKRLVADADVVVANMPDEVLVKLGLDYESIAAINPRAILAVASSFGSDGPLANHVGFDAVGQAMSGGVYLSGTADRPMRAQVNYVDFGTALHLAFGVMAALRQREVTGKGQRVAGSLLGTALAYTNTLTIEHHVLGADRPPAGNRAFSSGPTDIFQTTDGWIMTQIVGSAIFGRWSQLVGQPELADDPRFASDIERGNHGEILSDIMQKWCEGQSNADVLAAMAKARLPAAPILRPAEALNQPQVAAMHLVEPMNYPGARVPVPVIRSPIHLSDSPKQDQIHAPQLGDHSDEILSALGYSVDEIAGFRQDGIV